MQKTLISCLLLLCASPVFAGDLCDAQCSVFIDFPDGGSLVATEELTITFGDDALIDTGSTQTAYVADNTLVLNEGESLDFGVGGSFDIGDAGNIAYTALELVTPGEIDIVAFGEPETVSIINVTVSGGDAVFNVDASVLMVGPLTVLDGSLNLVNTGSIEGIGAVHVDELVVSSGGDIALTSAENTIGSVTIESTSVPPICSSPTESGGESGANVTFGTGPSAVSSSDLSVGFEPSTVNSSNTCIVNGLVDVAVVDGLVVHSSVEEIDLNKLEDPTTPAEESDAGAMSLYHLLSLLLFFPAYLARRFLF